MPRGSCSSRWAYGALIAVTCLLVVGGSVYTQEEEEQPAEPEKRLLEQEPHDVVVLDEANKNARVQVQLLPFPRRSPGNARDYSRQKPLNTEPRDKLQVVLMGDEPAEYEIFWRNIESVLLWEELLRNEAERLRDLGFTQQKLAPLDEAFEYYYELRAKYSGLPGLDASINRFLYVDAIQLTREDRFSEALGVVEELYRRDPQYQFSAAAPALIPFIGRLIDEIVEQYLADRRFGLARQLLKRIEADYGNRQPPSVAGWVQQLTELAEQKRDEARGHLEAGRFHEAITAARQMMDIWPDVEGVRELDAEISQKYPLVMVGVLQPATSHDAHRLDNWAARRTGRLVYRSMVEFLGAGPEGGQYQFALGMFERSDDQRRLILRLSAPAEGEDARLSGYQLARRLLDMADPQSAQYHPSWSGLVSAASVQDVMQVNVDLRQPHVLPEALLGVPLEPVPAGDEPGKQGDGAFRVGDRNESQVQFITKDFQPGMRLAEVVERTYEDAQQALAALRRGEIDVVDRLFPADAARLQQNPSGGSQIVIEQYALPTVHMLLVNTKNPFLANRDFRRALVFAVDRHAILGGELLGGRDVPGCSVISGPFPAGTSDLDPLAYAYDDTITPRRYAPRLAKLLAIVADRQVRDMAEKRGEPQPRLEPLVLGHPAHEAARVAAQAIAAYLEVVELPCTLKQFPPGVTSDPEGECDLVYAEIAIWEPLIDASRLFGEKGIAATDNPYVRRTLRWLDEAESWGDARQRLLELHRTVYNEVPIIPLWQITDFFAYNQRLRNVGERPVWLYQHIDQWRVGAGALAE